MDMFGYVPTSNVAVSTQPIQVQQRPDMRAADAFQSITSILQGGLKIAGEEQKRQQKNSFLSASKEANLLYDNYTNRVNETDDAFLKQAHLEEYKLGLESIKVGYELDEENSLQFDNATKRFIGSQEVAIDGMVKKQQRDTLDLSTSEIAKTMISSPTEDVVKKFSDIAFAYSNTGMTTPEVNEHLFDLYASMKVAGLRNDSIGDVTSVKQDIKDFAQKYDSKLVNKETYNKYMNALTKIENTQSNSMKEAIRILEKTDEFQNFMIQPSILQSIYEANNEPKTASKMFGYKKVFKEMDLYDPLISHPKVSKYPEEAKKKALYVQKQFLRNGDIRSAFDVGIHTEVVDPLKGAITGIFSEVDPKKFQAGMTLFTEEYKKNPSFVSSLMDNKQKSAFLYINFLTDQNIPVNEGTIKRIQEGMSVTGVDVKIDTDIFNKMPKDKDFLANIETIKSLTKFVGDSEKAYEMWEADRDAFKTDTVDLHGMVGGKGNRDDDYIDAVVEPAIEAGKELFPDADKVTLEFNAKTGTFFYNIDGIPNLDTQLTFDQLENQYKIAQEQAKHTNWETSKRNLSNNLKKWYIANKEQSVDTLKRLGLADNVLFTSTSELYNMIFQNQDVIEEKQQQQEPTKTKLEMLREQSKSQQSTETAPKGIQSNDIEIYKHLQSRENFKEAVYLDTEGFPTVGLGHKLTKEEQKQYPIGTKVPKEILDKWALKDISLAKKAANSQMKELGIRDDNLFKALTSVNYQLGTNWRDKFYETWPDIKNRNYSSAIKRLMKSDWYKQTPTRVNDFIEVLQQLQ